MSQRTFDGQQAFDGATAWSPTRFNLAAGGQTELIDGVWASGRFFEVLGTSAILGRTFAPDDDRRGGGPDGPVAVISYSFWQRRFGGSADVIGNPLMVERVSYTIIGVTPPEFFGAEVGRKFDVAIPIGTEPLVRGREATLPQDWPEQYKKTFLNEAFTLVPAATGSSGPGEAKRQKTDHDESDRHDLSQHCGYACRAHLIAAPPPEDGAKDAATIEREPGNHIERGERDVDEAEPHQHDHARRVRRGIEVPTERAGEGECSDTDDDARERSCKAHPEFGRCIRDVTLHLGDPAEREERNGRHGHAPCARDGRVRQLMEHDGGKERQGGESSSRPSQAPRPRGVHRVQMSGQRHREQRGNDEPAEMEADLDAEDAT